MKPSPHAAILLEHAKRHALERLRVSAEANVDLLDFIPRVSRGRLESPRHLLRVVELARRIDRGEPVRAIVATPPRHGKTTTWLHALVWLLKRHPDWPLAYITYASELAQSKSYEARNIAHEAGVQVSKDRANLGEWMTAQGGRFVATGVGGALTGRGFRCFPAGTMVATNRGEVAIERLGDLEPSTRVLCFNHHNDSTAWRRVLAWRGQDADDLVEVSTVGGRRFRCTPDHRVFVAGHGYREAALLTRADSLVVSADVRMVQDGVHQAAVRGRQGHAEGPQGLLLLANVLQETPRGEERQGLRDLFEADAWSEHPEVLLQDVQAWLARGHDGLLRGMRRAVQAAERVGALLQEDLLWSGPLTSNAWNWQLALQGRQQLREVLRGDERLDMGERPRRVRGLPREGDHDRVPAGWNHGSEVLARRPPHRREQEGQPPGEPHPSLRVVPHNAPQVALDTVAMVRPVRCGRVGVYDIQVEEHGNFFADGVLVHNCVLTDDPFKGRQEADSPLIRERTYEWFNSVAFTRQEPAGTAFVVNATRWHPDDLSGRLIAQGWEYVNLRAIDDDERSLWPDKFSTEWLRAVEAQIGPYEFGALYQGEPRQRGTTVFSEPTYYDALPVGVGFRTVIGNDFAYTVRTWSDFSVAFVLRRYTTGVAYVVEVLRMRCELPEFRRQLRAVANRHPGAQIVAFVSGTEKGGLQFFGEGQNHERVHVEPMPAVGDKFQRAQPVAAAWGNGKIQIPRNMAALGECGAHLIGPDGKRLGPLDEVPWIPAMLDEVRSFTGVKDAHDDVVDAMAGAYEPVRMMTDGPTTVGTTLPDIGSRYGDGDAGNRWF